MTALPAALAAACTRAGAENKTVMLEFFSYNSVESKMLRDNVLASPVVKAITDKRWVLVSFEWEREPALREFFGITRAPALVLVRSDGTEIDRLAGYPSPEELVRVLQGAGGGKTEVAQLLEKTQAPNAGLESHLDLATAYSKRGNYAQAAAEYVTCLDRVTAPGPDQKYLKLVLARLSALAQAHPPVLEAMRTRRDALEKEPTLKPDLALVLFAFNDALKESNRNADFYLKLPADSIQRQQLFAAVFLQLVETQHYTEATGTIDLESFVNSLYPQSTTAGHTHEGPDKTGHDHMAKVSRQRVVDITGAAVQALLATDRLEKAKRLSGRLLETFDGKATRQHLDHAAQRSAGKTTAEFIAWLQAHPMSSMPVSEKPAIAKPVHDLEP
jgi:tetratricopeptide (TPR) repeat protein